MNFHDNSKNENRKIDFSFNKNKQKKLTFCLVGILSVDILFVEIMSHNRLEITDGITDRIKPTKWVWFYIYQQ